MNIPSSHPGPVTAGLVPQGSCVSQLLLAVFLLALVVGRVHQLTRARARGERSVQGYGVRLRGEQRVQGRGEVAG
eukprot:scaffold65187_cov67-Phaeocystis_antarctica.AAC.5